MKYLGSIVLILICVGVGYVVEPIFIADKKEVSEESEGAGKKEASDEDISDKEEVTPEEPIAPPTKKVDLGKITPDSIPTPEPTSTPIPEPEPTPESEPLVTPEPEPKPEPASAPATDGKLNEAAIIALMKASVKSGKVTEFQASQVTAWKAGSQIEFGEVSYQTGIVTFKAETILGVQEHDALALIKNGAVDKWLWAKSKLEMR